MHLKVTTKSLNFTSCLRNLYIFSQRSSFIKPFIHKPLALWEDGRNIYIISSDVFYICLAVSAAGLSSTTSYWYFQQFHSFIFLFNSNIGFYFLFLTIFSQSLLSFLTSTANTLQAFLPFHFIFWCVSIYPFSIQDVKLLRSEV